MRGRAFVRLRCAAVLHAERPINAIPSARADRVSGKPAERLIDAADESDARAQASSLGLMVETFAVVADECRRRCGRRRRRDNGPIRRAGPKHVG